MSCPGASFSSLCCFGCLSPAGHEALLPAERGFLLEMVKMQQLCFIWQSVDAEGKAEKLNWGGSRVERSKSALACPCRRGSSSSQGAKQMDWPFQRGLWQKRPHQNGTCPVQFGKQGLHVGKSTVYMSWF